MRVLFSTGSPRHYMAPPQLGTEQINCGPDWPTQREFGRITSVATSVGAYDLAALVNRLPPEQRPDAVVCLVDASRRNWPCNLRAIRCPRVLLLADTHHMEAPLTHLLRYAAAEPFDRIVVLYDRHHLQLLRAAGLKNLHWFPGLTFPHDDFAVGACRRPGRATTVAFVGQRGRHHPRRARLLDAMEQAGIPLWQRAVPQSAALSTYGGTLIGFNASLNGDLNLRTFEILAAGGMLLTDRLAPDSGLLDLWQERRQLVTYRNADELVALARHYLEHPDEARAIGAAAQSWFDRCFNSRRRREAFAALVSDGVDAEEFVSNLLAEPAAGPQSPSFVAAYELVQELHRVQESVTVLTEPGASAFAAACATLPRVRVITAPDAGADEVDLVVASREAASTIVTRQTCRVFVWDATAADLSGLKRKYAEWGFSMRGNCAVFVRDAVPLENPVMVAPLTASVGDAGPDSNFEPVLAATGALPDAARTCAGEGGV